MNLTTQISDAVSLEYLWADAYGIKITESKENADDCANAIALALKEAKSRSARQVLLRLIKTGTSHAISGKLPSLGFSKKFERVEFRRAVELLPNEHDTPLHWRTAAELGWTKGELARVFAQIASGDPDTDPNEDPLQFIEDCLQDPVLTSGLDCFHLGFVQNEVAGLSVVQIDPETGWSRISYMGVAPEFRSQGLGKWVHRRGFTVMKTQGGKLYHGGTAMTNPRMIRLFELHDCERFREMEEWICVFHALKGAMR